MRLEFPTINVTSAGTAVQVSSSNVKVLFFYAVARPDNANNVFLGLSTVASTYGLTFLPGQARRIELGQYAVPVSDLYVNASTSSDKMDFVLGLEF